MFRILLPPLFLALFMMPLAAHADQVNDAHTAIVSQDYQTALKLLRPLADGGNVGAQFWLAEMYHHGYGVNKDEAEAAKLYRGPAEQGNYVAQYELGAIYRDTAATAKDFEQAYYWHSLCSHRHSDALLPCHPTIFEKHLTVEQKTALDKSVQDWLDAHPLPPPMPVPQPIQPAIVRQPASVTQILQLVPVPPSVSKAAQETGHTISAQPNPDGSFTLHIEPAIPATHPAAPLVNASTSTPLTNEKVTQTNAQQSTLCSRTPSPSDPLFANLKGLNLLIRIPDRLQKALDCHDREDDCARQFTDADNFISQLKADYKTFPPPLRPDNLSALFSARLTQNYLPFIAYDEQCHKPSITRIDKTHTPSLYQNDTVTVVVSLSVDDYEDPATRPTLAVLTVTDYRPNYAFPLTEIISTKTVALPLDMSDSDLTERLNHFVDHAIGQLLVLPVQHGKL